MFRLAIFALFFGSGMAGLIYQVVWTKLLTLIFGVTLLAVSTVLTCFFGGLALGSYLGGRWVDRRPDGFKWYGYAEILIGVYALIFLGLLSVDTSVYVMVARKLSLGFFGLNLLKFVLSAFLLFIPTTLMGATLPILSKALAHRRSRFARDVGGLYAVNTVGAVAGAVTTAFVFIPSFGLSAILIGTGLLNIAIGGTALYLGRSGAARVVESGSPEPPPAPADASAGPGADVRVLPGWFTSLVILGFAVSGFTGLAYEVIWTRVLGFMLTGTVYAFAAVLAVFLTGIAAGSFVFSSFVDRFRSRGTLITLFAVVEALIGLSSVALVRLYDWLPSTGLYARIDTTPVWGEFVYLNFLVPALTLIIPTFLFGATFPIVCKIYSWRVEGVGAKIGNIYSVNTVGGIFGSFITGFVLVPFVGMQNTIVLLGLVNVAVGGVFILANPYASARARAAALGAGAVAAIAAVLTLPANMPLSLHKSFLAMGEEIVYYKEGATATVMIAERPGYSYISSNKRLWVNGNRATAAYYEGLQINRFQGVLPMVLHPDPKDILVICFGSGTTFGTLSQFPVNMVDNVEIAGTVVRGATHFKRENMDVLNNPRARINIDDGRSFLAVTDKKFDVITEEPMHPALAGVVNLYTREYYELAKSRLKPDGIMSQWIPLYNLSVEDVRTMVRTFQEVFPHTTVWLANTDIFMIGSPRSTRIDYGRVIEKLSLPNVRRLLGDIDLEDPIEFLGTFVMNEDRVREYAASAAVMTDDMPTVEFTGPRSLNVNTISFNIGELLKYREPVAKYLDLPDGSDGAVVLSALERKHDAVRYNLVGRAYYADRNYRKAAEFFTASLKVDPTDRTSLHYSKRRVGLR